MKALTLGEVIGAAIFLLAGSGVLLRLLLSWWLRDQDKQHAKHEAEDAALGAEIANVRTALDAAMGNLRALVIEKEREFIREQQKQDEVMRNEVGILRERSHALSNELGVVKNQTKVNEHNIDKLGEETKKMFTQLQDTLQKQTTALGKLTVLVNERLPKRGGDHHHSRASDEPEDDSGR